MKLNKFLTGIGLLAALGLVACSDENVTAPENNQEISDGTPRYMAVNVMMNEAGGTRAVGDLTGNYEEGSEAENLINNIRFFFYDADGNATSVKADGKNYYDWSLSDSEKDLAEPDKDMNNVSKIYPAKIIISTKEGDKLPQQVVAVTNVTEATMGTWTDVSTISKLKDFMIGYKSGAYNPAENTGSVEAGDFVMTNSVYKNGSSDFFAIPIYAKNICESETDAKLNPVDMYVERVYAKVTGIISASLEKDGTDGGYPVFKAVNSSNVQLTTSNDENIYVKILGWNVTAVSPKVSIIKSINPSWTDDKIMGSDDTDAKYQGPWSWKSNTKDNCGRSFWEQNKYNILLPTQAPFSSTASVTTENIRLLYGKFADASATKMTQEFTTAGSRYIFPNAATQADGQHKLQTYGTPTADYNNFTQVVVAAQLMKKNEDNTYSAFEIANYAGTDYTLDGLKSFMATYEADHIYYKEGETYKSITPDDLDFATIDEVGVGNGIDAKEKRRYAAYLKLSSTEGKGVNRTWYNATHTALTTVAVNEHLKAHPAAKIFTEGKTYYHFDIKHLGLEGSYGYKGIVRNHIYAFTIDHIYGLGTPVWNPNEYIIPENPDDKDSYIAARINVLSWRKVEQNVDLGQ